LIERSDVILPYCLCVVVSTCAHVTRRERERERERESEREKTKKGRKKVPALSLHVPPFSTTPRFKNQHALRANVDQMTYFNPLHTQSIMLEADEDSDSDGTGETGTSTSSSSNTAVVESQGQCCHNLLA
jgi:hypothetical protein